MREYYNVDGCVIQSQRIQQTTHASHIRTTVNEHTTVAIANVCCVALANVKTAHSQRRRRRVVDPGITAKPAPHLKRAVRDKPQKDERAKCDENTAVHVK